MEPNGQRGQGIRAEQLARMIDHTNLRPNAAEQDIVATCREAMDFHVKAVVINPVWVVRASQELAGSDTMVVTVAGFPLGANRTEFKIVEAVRGAIDGASEIDMVANIGWLVSGEFARTEAEIVEVRRALPESVGLKVIIETTFLNAPQLDQATRIVISAGAQFVKTSTGFFGGATVEQISALGTIANGRIGIKASGGVRTLKQCRDLIAAGANRIGTSATVAILQEFTIPNGP